MMYEQCRPRSKATLEEHVHMYTLQGVALTVVSNACCDVDNIVVITRKEDACWDRSCCHSWTQPQLSRITLSSDVHLALYKSQ